MLYLLDSMIISDLYDHLAPSRAIILSKLSTIKQNQRLAISVLTIYELEYGFSNASPEKKSMIREMLLTIKADFEVITLLTEGAQPYGALKFLIKNNRQVNSENIKKLNIDLMLAATAIVEQAILVTSDQIFKYLAEIYPALKVADWRI